MFPPVNCPDVTPVITVSPWALVPQQILWNQINEKQMFFCFFLTLSLRSGVKDRSRFRTVFLNQGGER